MFTSTMVFLKYFFSRSRHENILSGVAVDTESAQNIFNKVYSFGNNSRYYVMIPAIY